MAAAWGERGVAAALAGRSRSEANAGWEATVKGEHWAAALGERGALAGGSRAMDPSLARPRGWVWRLGGGGLEGDPEVAEWLI